MISETDTMPPSAIDGSTDGESRRLTEETLANTTSNYEVYLYGRVTHGFAIRGNLTDPIVTRAVDAATRQMRSWFHEYL